MATTYTVVATSGDEQDSLQVTVPAAAPTVLIEVDPADPTGMTVKMTILTNSGDGPVTVDWGDSTTVIDPVTVGQVITHQYAAPGTYDTKVTSKADGTAFVVTPVAAPMDVPLKITATQDATNPALYHFSIVGADQATTTVDFGDGTTPATVSTPAGAGTVDHTYTRA